MHKVGIRREDKNEWERRVPVIPKDMERLIRRDGLSFVVQASSNRVFSDEYFRKAGADVREDLAECGVVFAVKEIPIAQLRERVTYIFFSHTIKGQPYNMDMLRRLIELECNLVDYERITDEGNRRLIFFGRHAGLAGMIDTLWALGRRLAWEGISPNPFAGIKQTLEYPDLGAAKEAICETAARIKAEGLPESLRPLIAGFAGYGNVSLGAQEIFDLLPVETIAPDDLESFSSRGAKEGHKVYKTVFREEHMVSPVEEEGAFDLQEYYDHPEKYRAAFARHLPRLSVLMNCIYWNTMYPRLVTKEDVRRLFAGENPPPLRVVGDVSCDVGGAVEFTLKATMPDRPVYVYEPARDRIVDGVAGQGPVVLAVDNLPCELSLEASMDFSRALSPFIAPIARADYSVPFGDLHLPLEIKRAMILHQGAFTPDYRFMEKFIR